ncbi:MAG: helix-turn-helix domain-containing protein [Clostridia bacterium]|nr:helix-turn-helix domain-containing protein [Clostridia bacterium]
MMMTVKQAAEKWGVTARRVQDYCKSGRIVGAERFGTSWMIPDNAIHPIDMRKKRSEATLITEPLIRKTPFLDMTDLYTVPGSAEESIKALEYHPEAKILFESEIAYSRGEIDKVYKNANIILNTHSGFYAVQAGGMLLGLCAMWRGDIVLWEKARRHICEVVIDDENNRDIISISLAALDSSIYDISNFPEWFKTGIFEGIHSDALPAAKVFYIKYLYVAGLLVATKQLELDGVEGLTLLRLLPNIIEPMISEAVATKSIICEIYLRMMCAIVYHNIGENKRAAYHIDKSIKLALPDRLFGILVEHRKYLDTLLDERIMAVAPEVLETIKSLYQSFSVGWSNLSGSIRNKKISTNLSFREREVAKLAAFGMSNTEIAESLHISLAAVKQTIRIVFQKSGVNSRDELITIL